MARTLFDRDTLEAALVGLQLQKEQAEKRIIELRRRIGGKLGSTRARTATGLKRRALSAAARKKIAAAQRKRWAAYKKQGRGRRTA